MNDQAEVTLYPLRTRKLGGTINCFLRNLQDAGLTLHEGTMSSTLSGDVDVVFAAVGDAFRTVADAAPVVLLLKVSNTCPSMAQGVNRDG